MARPSVLVVDDDAALAENVGEIVEGLGVAVHLASSGREALRLAAEHGIDVALVDVRLPDVDGTALISQLRAMSPTTEVVLITGDATLDNAIAAVRGGPLPSCSSPSPPRT
jgi:DNA-binding NtrC family response regulator